MILKNLANWPYFCFIKIVKVIISLTISFAINKIILTKKNCY